MASVSKIQDELISATEYVWKATVSDSDNRLELIKLADRLPDPEWDRLSPEAQQYCSTVSAAIKAQKPIPAPPDVQSASKAKAKAKAEPEPDPAPKAKAKAKAEPEPEPAPAPKAKAKAKAEAEAEAEPEPEPEPEPAPAPAPKAKAKAKAEAEPAPKAKAKAKAEPEAEDSSAPERGKTVYTFRKITLLNPDWKKAEVAAECARLGYPVTPSTASLLWYGTCHTRKVMQDLNMI
jgi:outer membrane biosynthesis protein TonB